VTPSGLTSALFAIALTNGVYYYWYEYIKAIFEDAAIKKRPGSRVSLSACQNLLAGAVAGTNIGWRCVY
jgi:adenine nucleotide transporter 17